MNSNIIKSLLFLCLSFTTSVYAKELPEYQLKAAYIYNLMKFIEWPQKEKIVVCILGENPFNGSLAAMETKKIGEKEIQVIHSYSIAKLKKCDLIYVNIEHFKEIKNHFSNTLTISDNKEFLNDGGMIGLVKEQGKIKILLNYQKINKEGFSISSKLLNTSIVEFYKP